MDARRRSYLRALDIDVWERRSAGVREEVVVAMDAPQPAATHRPNDIRAPQATPASVVTVANTPSIVAADVANADWQTLHSAVMGCTRCPLHLTRTQGVFGVGNRTARWMIIGEAPGADEDRQGEPFVGRAGQLLNSMLKAMGLQREEVFIANILKSRPPNNRDPKPEEVRACIPYLFRQIELVNPTLILCVGRIAAQTLLETTTTIGKLRGQVHRLASGRPMIVTYHPAYLLRSPVEKRKSWADLVLAMRTFAKLSQA